MIRDSPPGLKGDAAVGAKVGGSRKGTGPAKNVIPISSC